MPLLVTIRFAGRAKLVRRNTMKQFGSSSGIMSDKVLEKMNEQNINRFWSKNFGDREYVDWERYKDVYEVIFGWACGFPWL